MRIIIALFTFIFMAASANAQEYTLSPGDVITVEVDIEPSLNRNILIPPGGRITFPNAGTIVAGGRSANDVQAALNSALRSQYTQPPGVFVSVASLGPSSLPDPNAPSGETIAIYFLGEVNAPGRVDVEQGTTLLQALAESGGVTNFAAIKRIQLRRANAAGTENVYTIDYHSISRGAQIQAPVILNDGDVILVPQRRLFE
ncbi:MAG: polysaccharide biosynthesis/export family protein [Mangrovicoccus sp.]